MKMNEPQINTETQFNAGIDTALEISSLAKQAEIYASAGNYPMWYMKLEAWERWMSPKFRDKKDTAGTEIHNLKILYMEDYKKYLKKIQNNRKVKKELNVKVKTFLTEYETSLMFWRDKFGYGMPTKEDLAKAAWR